MSWQQLTGRRVRLDGEVARVVHVDSFRVVLVTEPTDGASPRRMVVPQDDAVELDELDGQDEEQS
jgi:hypothetical protein